MIEVNFSLLEEIVENEEEILLVIKVTKQLVIMFETGYNLVLTVNLIF